MQTAPDVRTAVEWAVNGKESMVRCNTHDDQQASLHVAPGATQPVVMYDHAGCRMDDILNNAGIDIQQLLNERDEAYTAGEWTPAGTASHRYPYVDEEGTLLYEVLRVPLPGGKKTFRQRHPDPNNPDRWQWNMQNVRRVLYRLPEVLNAKEQGQTIWMCFAPDTEVLTPNGWVTLPELGGQDVAQYDKETGEVSFTQPIDRQVFQHDGELVSFESKWGDTLVTPDHRMLTKWNGAQSSVVVPAGDVGVQRQLPVAGRKTSGSVGITPDEARLIAAWQADGVDTARGHRVAWNLKKGRKLDRIHSLLDACGIGWRDQNFDSTEGWTYVTADRRDTSLLTTANKLFGWDILDWPLESRVALIEELGYWDGDFNGQNGIRFFTADHASAEVISAVASVSGYGSILRTDVREHRPEQGPQYVLNIIRKDWRTLGNKPERIPYSGLVYCLTVPTSFLVTRRNGKVTIAGNCEGEKDVESLRKRGEVATTSPMGAGKWRPEFADMLAGANVVIIPDGDATGRAHARTIRESLVAKECTVTIKEPMTGAKDITDHFDHGGDLTNLLETVPEVEEKRISYGIDVLDMIQRTVSETSFVIPGVLARGDRFLLTGLEGHGKSATMRQWAAQTAAGIHIWTGEEIEPQRVLYIDAENHPDQTLEPWQDLVGLCARHDRPLERGQLTILEEWDSEIDLTSEAGKEWLLERIHAYKPDLVMMGPLYTMSGRDLKDDETVRKIKSAVNEARSLYGSAIIMEHHAPHRQPGDKERSIRPYGSSTFLKFPEFGFGMKPTDQEGIYEFQKTRFPRIRKRHFPGYLRWGKPNSEEFFWVPCELDEETGRVIG